MKKLFFLGILLILVGGAITAYGVWAQDQQNTLDSARWEEVMDVEKLNVIIAKFNNAKTKGDCAALEAELSTLPIRQQESLIPQIKLKLAVLNFTEAEGMLDRARALQASLTMSVEVAAVNTQSQDAPPMYPPTTYPHTHKAAAAPSGPPKIHPAAMDLLDKASILYNESKLEVDRLAEVKNNSGHNFRLNYVKGEVYHRYTQLFATQETATELFNQTVTFYKHALRYKPADTNTVINIELLIRNERSMTGGLGQPQQQKNKLLNQAAGFGSSKGN